MRIIRGIKEMSVLSDKFRRRGLSVGFVPTMGALHQGHLCLIRKARKENDRVVVSIFVNPAQFGRGEDFKKYPRDLKADAALCRKEKVDVIFYPEAKKLYPRGYKTYVTVEGLSDILCGRVRPGHFRGVATIVSKLFNIVRPQAAYFGQKDAQQAAVVKRMAAELNMPVAIKVVPTKREASGLAMSSRNAYLSAREKVDAAVLWYSLGCAQAMFRKGVVDAAKIISRMKSLIGKIKGAKIDYIAAVDQDTFMPLKKISRGSLIVMAVWIGKTRLIDNIVIGNS